MISLLLLALLIQQPVLIRLHPRLLLHEAGVVIHLLDSVLFVYLNLYLLQIHPVRISFLLVQLLSLLIVPLGNFLLPMFDEIDSLLYLLSNITKDAVTVIVLKRSQRLFYSLLSL